MQNARTKPVKWVMRSAYYVKLAMFLLLATFGGLIGGIVGLVSGWLVSFLVIAVMVIFSNQFNPMAPGFLTIYIGGIAGFSFGFLHSYKWLVRHLW